MDRWVEISFDCLPLRSVTRLDVPLDASPKFRQFAERVKAAIDKHGAFNTYYLHNARCVYHLTNDASVGMLEFNFEGTVLTDSTDRQAVRCDLDVVLLGETCGWLSEPIVHWFHETVPQSVSVEFKRYIEAGSLEQTKKRIEKMQAASDESGGFVGMYL